MADDDWKKRVGIEINFSSDSSEDDGGSSQPVDYENLSEQISPKQPDSRECSYDGSSIMEDEIFSQLVDDYGSTPPRTRIRRKERRQREKEEQSVAKSSPKIIHAKAKRRNTLDSIYFELLERSESANSPQQDKEPQPRLDANKRTKRSMKLLRDSERDMKSDHANARYSLPPMLEHDDDRAESMPLIVPQPAIKVESCNRFMSLTSKLVACHKAIRPECQQLPTSDCSQERIDFYNTFSILIRMGSSEKQTDKNPRRQLSKEEHLWQNELKDLIWLELQAWHADRTITEQDEYLCKARENVGALLDEIMNYRYVKQSPGPVSTQSSDSGLGSDGKEDCAGFDPCSPGGSNSKNYYCMGCLSIYCHNCMESQVAALKDMEQLLNGLEAAEALYPSSKAFAAQYPVYKCPRFVGRVKAMCLWYNMTKHHRLKLLILGKLLRFLQHKNCSWPPLGEDDLNSSSGIATDTSASDDTSSHLSRSSSVEGKPHSKFRGRMIQFDMDSSSPSDSNNSNVSSHGTSSDAGMDVSELADGFDSRSIATLSSNALCHNIKPSPKNPYRKYIEDVLKIRGLRKSVNFLEKLHRNILIKAMLSLSEPIDSPSPVKEDTLEKNNDSLETLQDALSDNSSEKEEEELRRYGYWSKDAQALGLPSYRSAFLFLCRVPLDTIHEFLRMRLEEKPYQPSVLCIRQLMRELKEGLRIALLHRQRYLHLIRTALWDVDKVTVDEFEGAVVEFDQSIKSVLEMYLEYLQQWVPMVQHERLQKNLLEEEWQFVKTTCSAISGADGLLGKCFCEIASGMLDSIGPHMSSRVKDLIQQMHTNDTHDEESSRKQIVMSVYREFQTLINETRERALRAVCFAKTIVKDLEKADFVEEYHPKSKDMIVTAVHGLKIAALTLRCDIARTIRAVERICDEWDMSELDDGDCIALLARCREVLHLGYKFGFEYHKEISRIVTGEYRAKLSLGFISFAHQWMSFVKERCERGRGLRPRWANQGLDFLITVCEPHNTCYLTVMEFDDLKTTIDKCISHVVGTAAPPPSGPHFPHHSRSSLDGQYPRSRGSSPCSRTKSPNYLTSRSLQDTSLSPNMPTTQRSLSAHVGQMSTESDITEDQPDGDIAETLNVPNRALSRIERVQAAVRQLETEIECKLQKEDLIGSITEVESEDKIHIKSRSVTFSWQRGIKIGQGRFGKVYTAVNNKTGELLAMKEIQLQPNDHRTIRRVAEELRTFEGITHRALVRYYGVEIHREEMLIFMEFCAEGTLESLVAATESGLSETLIRRYTHQLLEAVATLHSHGVVHRDIKSANIFLTDEGNSLKLGDFGSAVKIKAHTTMPGELQGFVGTQAYMAPEVFMKTGTEGHGRSADIWSVGCVVVEMASGKRPWAEFDSNYQIMFKVGMGETPSAPPTLSEDGHQFLARCLQHDPRQRATAEELRFHTFVMVDGDEEYLSTTLPSIFEDYFKLGPKR